MVAVPLAGHRPIPVESVRDWWTRKGVEKPNVILITLDTTRADHLGCYGNADARTPALDGLARRGVLFSQAATPAPLTLPSHSSIMTGFYPPYHGVRLNGTTALEPDADDAGRSVRAATATRPARSSARSCSTAAGGSIRAFASTTTSST